jgi:hypothetical protein
MTTPTHTKPATNNSQVEGSGTAAAMAKPTEA